jgi:ubiquitin-like 1-activating enzyme E1 B
MVRQPSLRHVSGGNSVIAKEIENLRNEAKILQSIRNEMGSPDFARKVFEKVFTDDVNRLRSMEDMWKTRKPPTALDFESTCEAAKSVEADIWRKDQKTWKVAENFAVFVDRYG